MTPELSEFSYGFALTHEIANLAGANLRFAPIFPTQFEEGKVGGGYDVKLDWAGLPIFLQFKRSDCLIRNSAKQILDGLPLQTPFYRFSITERHKSSQHDLLLELDVAPNQVFYVAPRFHLVSELNAAYSTHTLAKRSLFIKPSDIGALDNQKHCIAFDNSSHFVCSEPRQIPALDGIGVRAELLQQLAKEHSSLRDKIEETHSILIRAVNRHSLPFDMDIGLGGEAPEKRQLQNVADLALRYFNAQFFVAQDAEAFMDEG